jgi:hypothetical protein
MNTKYEAMCEVGFVLTRTSTQELLKYLTDGDLWDFIVENGVNRMSEYNMYGSFVYHVFDREYFHNINRQIPRERHIVIRWSWGGITPEIHQQNMDYLSN